MYSDIAKLLERCISQLEQGKLTGASLREEFTKLAVKRTTKQNILTLLANSTSLHSTVQGMSLYKDGVLSDGPIDPEEWPYQKISDAIDDGWRVVQFPVAPAVFLDQKQRFIPCEFVLEKIVEVFS